MRVTRGAIEGRMMGFRSYTVTCGDGGVCPSVWTSGGGEAAVRIFHNGVVPAVLS